MTKPRPLVLMLVHFFKSTIFVSLILINILFININLAFSDEKSKKNIKNNDLKSNFGAAVVDMQKVLSKSTAWASLQKQVKEIEENFKAQIKGEEESLKKEQGMKKCNK